MSDEAKTAQPDAGKLFTVRTGVTGPDAVQGGAAGQTSERAPSGPR
jgi:hypothetical protein